MSPPPRPRSLRALVLSILLPLFLLGGCATTNPRDPLEPMNRAIYSFNDGLDKAIFKPVAEGYRAVLPTFVRRGVSNIFANINDVLIALNNLLQGKIVSAVSDLGRVLVNTTVGIAGFFDVATNLGLEKHNEDFGQTLGYWGIGDGPYLVLPIIGPSNLRDALARIVDFKTDPLTYLRSMRLRNSMWGTRALSVRADLLDTSKILETAALDPYEFLRDAYLQRRRSLVYDGAPPDEKDDARDLKTKPRTSSPYPPSAEENINTEPGAPGATARADERSPAPGEALEAAAAEATVAATPATPVVQELAVTPEPAAATAPATEAPREIVMPAEPTAAAPALEAQTAAAPVPQPQPAQAVTPEFVAPAVPSTQAPAEIVLPSEPTAAGSPTLEPLQAVTPVPPQTSVPAVTAEPVVPAAPPAAAAQLETVVPAEPRAAAEPAVGPQAQRVVRIWVRAAD